MPTPPTKPQTIGFYVHVPFCARICHYCDFAKTANYDDALVADYFASLVRGARQAVVCLKAAGLSIGSLYFGGGTPGLFVEPYEDLMAALAPALAAGAEVTMELNPEAAVPWRLQAWRAMGFNRVSLGIQSFNPAGLTALTRSHSRQTATDAVTAARQVFANTNVDLIFGWQGQDRQLWQQDLQMLLALGAPHASVYSLTYEGQTVMARQVRRGIRQPLAEDREAVFYADAQEILGSSMHQEEVANFALPGYAAVHNRVYWEYQPYWSLGVGAHGFLRSPEDAIGRRYAIGRGLKGFLAATWAEGDDWQAVLNGSGIVEWDERDAAAAMLERVWLGLRFDGGLAVVALAAELGYDWQPRGVVATALAHGTLQYHEGVLRLDPKEWFRESAWTTAVASCFAQNR